MAESQGHGNKSSDRLERISSFNVPAWGKQYDNVQVPGLAVARVTVHKLSSGNVSIGLTETEYPIKSFGFIINPFGEIVESTAFCLHEADRYPVQESPSTAEKETLLDAILEAIQLP